jgi:hypothetical protein
VEESEMRRGILSIVIPFWKGAIEYLEKEERRKEAHFPFFSLANRVVLSLVEGRNIKMLYERNNRVYRGNLFSIHFWKWACLKPLPLVHGTCIFSVLRLSRGNK